VVIYADTSFLVSLYGEDTNSEQARTLAHQLSKPFYWTDLVNHECCNAFRLGQFRGELNASECEAFLSCIREDQTTNILIRTPLDWSEVYRCAEKMAEKYTPGIGSRSLDILHVASAQWLDADCFVSFDRRQNELARNIGLHVENI